MATLHVRNFPDELYEILRERATANGRSIGAETCQLLFERLVAASGPPRSFPVPGLRRRPAGPPGVFTRFTAEARQAVVLAQEEARNLGHDHVGTEHLLLGVLVQSPGIVDLAADAVRAQLEPGEGVPATGQIPFHPETKRALELSLRACIERRDELILPGHLLAGIAGAGGRGAEILRDANVDVAAPTLRMRPFEAPDPSFRVILLEGETEEWEKQLNDAATLGYELVEIVDRRAIFRR
ncbi:MAG TPA: Clp protease N-terminal domain-containing protein [Gaiellaceae bacterium]|nr:Clp protease N-terminal domain-containing protein [Gaiellaceae bacterium]